MAEQKDYFPNIKTIQYNPKAASTEALVFRHYNPKEKVLGKPMEDWCRFSVCYWHTFRGDGHDPFGAPTIKRAFDDGSNTLENAKRRLHAAFEFMSKLGVKYWCFHDRDIAPEGATIEETNKNLDEVVAEAKKLQEKTGIKLLWGTANLFNHPRFMNGAGTNPDPQVFMYACAQVKKAIEVTKELGGENYVFWGGREGYVTLLNTDVKKELDHLAAFLKMAVEHKKKIGFKGQFLIEPKAKEPTKHQYDYDAQTVIGFLKSYGLDKDFKLNIEPNHTTLAGHSYEHDLEFASRLGFLGSIDANTGDQSLGWDTDQFPTNLRDAVYMMRAVVRQGGLGTGGLNFDAKLRRESVKLEDLFVAHISGMDTIAKALKVLAAMEKDGNLLDSYIAKRYLAWGKYEEKVLKGQFSFEDAEKEAKAHGEPAAISGEQEKLENLLNYYLFQ